MVKRKKIGLFIFFNSHWMGGVYYILNIIKALNLLPDNKKPEILIIHLGFENFIEKEFKAINYPYIRYNDYRRNIIVRIINKIYHIVFKKNLFKIYTPIKPNIVDLVYPVYPFTFDHGLIKHISKKILWIPDFQEKHLPELFSKQEIEVKHKEFYRFSQLREKLVLSSQDAFDDFKTYYSDYKNEISILSFSSILPPKTELVLSNELKTKFGIEEESYFFVSNQFMKHKNHLCVVEAVKILLNKKIPIKVLFSGKLEDYRGDDHIKLIRDFVSKNKLSQSCIFLGLINKKEQLSLMANSKAIIQPSFFEGWSTVVEDAKALNKIIILSDLRIHKEQIQKNAYFFNPNSSNDLADTIIKFLSGNKQAINYDYNLEIERFKSNLLKLFEIQ